MILKDILNTSDVKNKILNLVVNSYFPSRNTLLCSTIFFSALTTTNPMVALYFFLCFHTGINTITFFSNAHKNNTLESLLSNEYQFYGINVIGATRNLFEGLEANSIITPLVCKTRFFDTSNTNETTLKNFVRDALKIETTIKLFSKSGKFNKVSRFIATTGIALNRGIILGVFNNICLTIINNISKIFFNEKSQYTFYIELFLVTGNLLSFSNFFGNPMKIAMPFYDGYITSSADLRKSHIISKEVKEYLSPKDSNLNNSLNDIKKD
jgi:hypothetical protein